MDRKQNWRGNQQWNLEAESIRSRAESTGGSVELKTVTEIRWSSACDTVVAQSVYLVLNSLLDWEPVDRLKQRSDVFKFYLVLHEALTARLFVLIYIVVVVFVPHCPLSRSRPNYYSLHCSLSLKSCFISTETVSFGCFPFR